MGAITIEYQMGCGGRDIGRMLAERLGFGYMDREIVQNVANELHIEEDAVAVHDERVAGIVERTLSLLRIPGELAWLPPTGADNLDMLDENIYHRATCQVIEAAARRDKVVIVGHGSSFALAGWHAVMHLGLYAPLEHRVATVMRRLSVDHATAQRRASQSDQERARYMKHFYQVNWHDAEHYHLMLDTSIFAPERVVDLIMQAWQLSSFGANHDTPSASQ